MVNLCINQKSFSKFLEVNGFKIFVCSRLTALKIHLFVNFTNIRRAGVQPTFSDLNVWKLGSPHANQTGEK